MPTLIPREYKREQRKKCLVEPLLLQRSSHLLIILISHLCPPGFHSFTLYHAYASIMVSVLIGTLGQPKAMNVLDLWSSLVQGSLPQSMEITHCDQIGNFYVHSMAFRTFHLTDMEMWGRRWAQSHTSNILTCRRWHWLEAHVLQPCSHLWP